MPIIARQELSGGIFSGIDREGNEIRGGIIFVEPGGTGEGRLKIEPQYPQTGLSIVRAIGEGARLMMMASPGPDSDDPDSLVRVALGKVMREQPPQPTVLSLAETRRAA